MPRLLMGWSVSAAFVGLVIGWNAAVLGRRSSSSGTIVGKGYVAGVG